MLPNIQGYTRVVNFFTGRTTYYRGGSGHPMIDAFCALFTMDQEGGRLISMIIITPFTAIFGSLWGVDLMGSRGGVIFGVLGCVVGLILGFVLAQRFTQFLGFVIVGTILWLVMYVIGSMLVNFWHADDPTYPSAILIRQDVMGDELNCKKVDSQWSSIRFFELNKQVLNTQHFVCHNENLLQLDKNLNAAFDKLNHLDKQRREAVQSTLNTFRRQMFKCMNENTKEACIRESYNDLSGIINSALHP